MPRPQRAVSDELLTTLSAYVQRARLMCIPLNSASLPCSFGRGCIEVRVKDAAQSSVRFADIAKLTGPLKSLNFRHGGYYEVAYSPSRPYSLMTLWRGGPTPDRWTSQVYALMRLNSKIQVFATHNWRTAKQPTATFIALCPSRDVKPAISASIATTVLFL